MVQDSQVHGADRHGAIAATALAFMAVATVLGEIFAWQELRNAAEVASIFCFLLMLKEMRESGCITESFLAVPWLLPIVAA